MEEDLSSAPAPGQSWAGRGIELSCWGSSVLPNFAGASVPSPAVPPEQRLGSSVDQSPEALQAALSPPARGLAGGFVKLPLTPG